MQNNGSHIISFNIRLSDPGDRKKTLEQVCDEMRQDLKYYPELSKARVILGGSNTGLTGQSTADFEIYGYDMSVTDSVAANLKRQLYQIKGVSEVNISRSDYQPEYQVDFDREKLAMHGLNLSTAGTYFVIMDKLAHASQKVGLASAMAVVLLIIILLVTFIQKAAFKYFFGEGEQEAIRTVRKRKKEENGESETTNNSKKHR